MYRLLTSILPVLTLLLTAPLIAGEIEPNTQKLGLGGYSPVSYFQPSGPQFGSPQHQATHEGVTYLLADEAELKQFNANPAKYAPAYGGWCAFGMAVEGKFGADPTNYKIVNDQLLVFLKNDQMDTRDMWNEGSEAELTTKADVYWNKINNAPSRAYLGSQNVASNGVALSGYSPVSYFTKGYAEQGSPDFAVDHQGVTYLLTDAKQAELFKADPAKYAPAFGGWCAFGMSISDKFPIDPTNFKIVDDQLMVFLRNENIDARELWNKGETKELKHKANAHWMKVQG